MKSDLMINKSHNVSIISNMIACFPSSTYPIHITSTNSSHLGYILCAIALRNNPDLTVWRAIEVYAQHNPPGIVDNSYIHQLYHEYGSDMSLQPQCNFFYDADTSAYVDLCTWSMLRGLELKRTTLLTSQSARLIDPDQYRVSLKLKGVSYIAYKPPNTNNVYFFGKNKCSFKVSGINIPGDGKTILYGTVRSASRYDKDELTFDVYEVVALDNNLWLSNVHHEDRLSMLKTILSSITYDEGVNIKINVVDTYKCSDVSMIWTCRVHSITEGIIFLPYSLHLPMLKWEPKNTVHLFYKRGKVYCNGRTTTLGHLTTAADGFEYKIIKCTPVSDYMWQFVNVCHHLLEPDTYVKVLIVLEAHINLESIENMIKVRDRAYVPAN